MNEQRKHKWMKILKKISFMKCVWIHSKRLTFDEIQTSLQYTKSTCYSMVSSENDEKGNSDSDEAQNILVISFATLSIACPLLHLISPHPRRLTVCALCVLMHKLLWQRNGTRMRYDKQPTWPIVNMYWMRRLKKKSPHRTQNKCPFAAIAHVRVCMSVCVWACV